MSLTYVVLRRRSKDPPISFRIVLVGDDWLNKNEVGNLLLGKDVFEGRVSSSPEKNHNTGFSGYVEGRCITVANSADLFTPDVSDDDLKQRVTECVSICAPGPHALVLVVNAKDFSAEKRKRMEHIVNSFSEQAFQHSVVFIYKNHERDQEDLKKLTELCQQRVFQWHHYSSRFRNSERQRYALQSIEDIVSENKFCYIPCDKDAYDLTDKYLKQLDKNIHTKQAVSAFSQSTNKDPLSSNKLNLVLCGSSAAAKASAAALILGEQTEPSPQPSSVCVKREAEVCGRHVTLVLMPALGQTQLSEALLQETQKCVHICDSGVHAFIFITDRGLLTDEDKEEFKKFKHFFGEEVVSYCQIVLTRESERPVSKEINELSQGSHHILDHNSKVLPLLQSIEKMRRRDAGCYTSNMYITAQLRIQLECHSQLENMKTTIQELQSKNKKGSQQGGIDDLRIVLLGKTGSGKSASGNTILGVDVFAEEISSTSVTTVCQKETAMVCGRQITVIDTPGLFDTTCDNEEIMKEIIRCIAMAAPGPHVFLLVIPLGRFTSEEKHTVKMVTEMFGEESKKYTLVLFTRGDDLQGKTFEKYLKKADLGIKSLLSKCGNRHHLFNNRDKDEKQVSKLLDKIDVLLNMNKGKYYTSEIFQEAEESLSQEQSRILKEREEEIQSEKEELKAKHEAEIEKLKREMEEERIKREEEFRCKEQDMKKTIDMEERHKRLEMEEKYKADHEQKESEIKQQIEKLQLQRQREQEEWEEKIGAEQKRWEEEEEWRKIKEEAYRKLLHERLRDEMEKLSLERERSALQEQFRQEQEKYEREKQEEKQRRKAEEALRKLEEDKERREIENRYEKQMQEKVSEMRNLQEWFQSRLEEVEWESREREEQQLVEVEKELRRQREYVEQKLEEAIQWGEYNIQRQEENYEREKEQLKREAELAARKQAEKEFNEELDRRVKEAKIQGHEEGYREGHKVGKAEGIRENIRKYFSPKKK